MSFIVKTNGAYLPAVVKDISQELNGMETATLVLENNISTREFVAVDRPIEIYWGGTEVFTGTLQKVSYSEDGDPKLTCVAFDTVYDTLDKKTITATYDASDDSDDIESILAAIAAAAGLSSSCSLTGASYRRSLRFNKTSCYDAVQFLATAGNTDYYSSGSTTIVIGDRGTDRGTIPVLSISRSAVDRHVKRDKVEIRGFDVNGNEITGSAGVGTNVVTYTEYKASDTTTLDQIAESKLDKLNKDSSGISIKVSTGYAYLYEPGDTVTLSKDSLNLSGSYRIWKITKREDVCNVEIDVPEALLETYLSKQKQLEDLGIYTGAALLDLPVGPPATPATPTVTGMIDGIQLSWTANTEADMNHYDVYRNTTSASGTASKLGEVAGTILTDPNKNYNQYYYYWLKAVDNTDHTSGFGSVASGKSRRASGVNIAPSSIDTNHLSDNAITGPKIEGSTILTTHLQDALITNAKILTGAVSELKIAASAISANKIQINAITSPKILDGAITELKIAASSVSANKIATNAIVERTIAAGQITTTKIANDSITSALIAASTIVSANIAAGGILATNIGADQITSTHIAASSIVANNITADAVTALHIAASSVYANALQANSIYTRHIGADQVTATQIAASTITSANIIAGGIAAINIAASSITSNKIFAGAVVTSKLAADAVTANEIAASSIYANALQADSVNATHIAASSIYTNSLQTDAVTARTIAGSTITANLIGADAILAIHIAASSIYTNALQANSITLGKMGTGSVDGTKITASSIATNHILTDAITSRVIAAGSITATKIGADEVNATHIAASSVYTNSLQTGSITLGKMGANSVDGTKITASSIATNHIQSDAVTARVIAGSAIVANLIAADAILAIHIAASSIYTNALQAGSITLGKMGSNSVDGTKITASSIQSKHFTADSVTALHIAASSIYTNSLQAGSITLGKLGSNSVDSTKITASSINTNHITTDAITARVIAGSAIVSNLIAADAVLAVNIFAGAVTSDKITSANIYGKRFATSSGVGRAGGATGIRFFDSGIILYGGGTTKKIELSTAAGARPRMTLYGSGVLDFYNTAGGSQDGLIGHGGYTYGSGIEIYAPTSKVISLNGGGGGLYIAKGGNIIPRAPYYGASYGISGNTGSFTTIRVGNLYATSISGGSITTHFRDAFWGDLICPICDEPFKPGDTLGMYVKAIEHSEIRTVPAHLHDFRKL